ncbi:hypothetical protein [Bellilinea sp.]|jgi:hypothetical protein|uniref:hypothetical protein n=1 Tax=Bellilinea sp. TaxID=2838785 RepID=UPI002ADE12ED|nr:hypothetical protein [Bellilinea sp.]
MERELKIAVEKIVIFEKGQKSNVSGFADVPLTLRLRSADVDADATADVVFSRNPTSPLFLWCGYVCMGDVKHPPKNG